MDSIYFSIGKSCFLFLYFFCDHSLHIFGDHSLLFLCDHSLHFFVFSAKPVFCDYGGHSLHYSLSANPIFYSSMFYATMMAMASIIPCPRILFSVPQFFMRLRRLLFLLRVAHFLFLSFLCDYGLCFSLS